MYDPGSLYSDPILTNFSVGYQPQELFGTRLMPETPVGTQSGRYRVYDRSHWLIYPSRREPGTSANEIRGRKWSEDTFKTKEHSLKAAVLDEEDQQLQSLGGLANAVFGGDLAIDPHEDAAEDVLNSLLLEHELKTSVLLRNTATYPVANTVTLSGSQQWNDHTFVTAGDPNSVVSNPIGVIRTAMMAVYNATKRYPNVLAMPKNGGWYIEHHPRIVDRFKNFTLLQPDAFRLLTGFDGQIILYDSIYNAADNIDAAESLTDFWGKDVWLGLVDPTPGQRTQTFGKTFMQTYPDGTTRPTDRWRDEDRKADLVRVSVKYDLKVVNSSAGYLIKNAFATSAF